MAYTITFWRGTDDVKSVRWLGSFETAQARADARLAIEQAELGVTHVAVSDERTGVVLYTTDERAGRASAVD